MQAYRKYLESSFITARRGHSLVDEAADLFNELAEGRASVRDISGLFEESGAVKQAVERMSAAAKADMDRLVDVGFQEQAFVAANNIKCQVQGQLRGVKKDTEVEAKTHIHARSTVRTVFGCLAVASSVVGAHLARASLARDEIVLASALISTAIWSYKDHEVAST